VQSKESLQLLQQYGINHVEVAGDTRFDRVQQIADQAQPIPVIEDFVQKNNGKKVIVAGSTWAEDEMLLARFLQQHEDVVLILVPHEVNVEHLREIFQTFHGRFVRYTEATPANIGMCRVLMIDTLGMLSRIYQYADTAYIGGGFGVGIHNTLEAAVYGTPVIFGPHYHKFREAKGLIQAGAAKSVHDYDTFAQAMTEALEQRQTMGQCAKDYVISELGATEYIFNKLFCK
jgi:3-deoxy-D-manno-octulosonic-acid transferase